jgi:acyl-CoA thioesterase-2
MAIVESAWESHPGYRIDLVPHPGVARVWHGDLLLAESSSALRLIETRHVERLYFPMSDVRLDLLEENDHHTICPFKGEADYWSLRAGSPPLEDVFWTYRRPFPQVEGIEGYLGVYHEKVRTELESRWLDDERAVSRNLFPVWGDQADLVRLLDAEQTAPNRFVAPGYHERTRNVVEGGQLLGQAIVAASKANPGQRVTSAFATFAKAASFDDPIDLDVEVLRQGRSFSSLQVRARQNGALISPTLLLMDAPTPDTLQGTTEMPDVPGPYDCEPFDMRLTGRDLRVVDGAYSPDPDRVGPPVIYAWLRFRDDPAEQYLRDALVAQATTHWTIAAAMRPHRGYGEADAHVTLSTGIMSTSIAFGDPVPLDGWLLYANPAIWSGRGLAQGEGKVFAADGRLVASYSVQAMIRRFIQPPEAIGKDATNAM